MIKRLYILEILILILTIIFTSKVAAHDERILLHKVAESPPIQCEALRELIVSDTFYSYEVGKSSKFIYRAAHLREIYFELGCPADELANDFLKHFPK